MSQQELQVQEKQELKENGERTEPGRYYAPFTDIQEVDDAIIVTMDMPGVTRDAVDITLDKRVLSIVGRVDLARYEGLEALYTEYNVGHYSRTFTISSEVDRDGIGASVSDGVLTLTLPKVKEATARRIAVS